MESVERGGAQMRCDALRSVERAVSKAATLAIISTHIRPPPQRHRRPLDGPAFRGASSEAIEIWRRCFSSRSWPHQRPWAKPHLFIARIRS